MKMKFIFTIWIISLIQPINLYSPAAFGDNQMNNYKSLILGNKLFVSNILETNKRSLLSNIDLSNKEVIYSEETYKEYFKIFDSVDWEFYSKLIPEKYMVSFMYFTRDKRTLRPLIYAIMKHESLNFLQYTNKNKNGTIDHGPMMVNSNNLKNPLFMKLYAPDREKLIKMGFDLNSEIGKHNYYIGIGINLFFSLLDKYIDKGEQYPITLALKAYNGGEGANSPKASLSKQRKTTRYAKTVLDIYYLIEKT